MRLSIQGKYQDAIRDFNALELLRSSPRSNVVVFRAIDLIAGLLRNEPGLGGISYWAVGSGQRPLWCTAWGSACPVGMPGV